MANGPDDLYRSLTRGRSAIARGFAAEECNTCGNFHLRSIGSEGDQLKCETCGNQQIATRFDDEQELLMRRTA